jgi:putative transcriptional regulator
MKSHDTWVEHNPGERAIDASTDWNVVNALTEEQVHAAALAETDAQPIPRGTEEDLERLGSGNS